MACVQPANMTEQIETTDIRLMLRSQRLKLPLSAAANKGNSDRPS
jgi:hypothetical protein